MPPRIDYARAGSVRIAYQVVGDGPVDLLWDHSILGNLDLSWTNPAFVSQVEDLASFTRLIMVNERGVGISDRPAPLEAFEQRMDDFAAVMDAVGSRRAHLLTASNAAALGCLFAATQPERTRSLILWGCEPRILTGPDYPWGEDPDAFDRRVALLEEQGLPSIDAVAAAARGSVWAGPRTGRDPAFWEWWGRVFRSTGPAAFVAWLRTQRDVDVRPILPTIRVPTLVMQGEDDPDIPVDRGAALAAAIPDARFEVIPGIGHLWNDAWPTVLSLIREWVQLHSSDVVPSRFVATLLALELAEASEPGRSVPMSAEQHERYRRMARQHIAAYGGVLIEGGLGLYAQFGAAARAIVCSRAIQGDAAAKGIPVGAAVHTGELERVAESATYEQTGLVRAIAARALPGQLLVTSTAQRLAIGCGAQFTPAAPLGALGTDKPIEVFSTTIAVRVAAAPA